MRQLGVAIWGSSKRISCAFTNPNLTLEEQIELVAAMMVKDFGFTPEDAREQCKEGIPNLKRWKKA